MKYIAQHDISDCGVACLAMISYYYGLKYPLQKYRELSHTGKNGTSLQGIIDGAERLGFVSEALCGSFEELIESIKKCEIKLPCIAHYSIGHYVIIEKIKKDSIVIINPQNGRKRLSIEEFINSWSGYLINLFPGVEFKKGNHSISSIKKLLLLLAPMYKKIVIIFILSFGVYLFGIVTSLTFEAIIDEFSLTNNKIIEDHENNHSHDDHHGESNTSHDHSEIDIVNTISSIIDWCYSSTGSLGSFFILLSLMYIINMAMFYLRGKTVIKLAQAVDFSLTYKYYCKMLKIPLREKNMRRDGDYISRFSDSYRIRYAISNATVTILLDAILGILGGILLIQINFTMTIFAVGIIVLYAIGAVFFQKRLTTSNKYAMETSAEMQAYFKEVMNGYETIKRNSLVKETERIGSQKYKSMLSAFYKNDIVGLKESTFLGIIELMGNAGILWIGFSNVLSGNITLGSLISFTMLMSCFTEPLKNIVQLQPTIQSASVSLNRLYDVFDITEENNKKQRQFIVNGDICFANVSFQYTEGVDVIKNISFTIGEKSRTALVGLSGCGKTTLMKLLSRLYEPSQGEIFIGNENINEFDLDDYRQDIYYVDNSPFMFENTIRYNLIENKDISDEKIINACKMCLIDDYIYSIPFGLDTIIRENGDSISQGQKQRLGIARAILHKPKVIILDEAFSNLSLNIAEKIFDNLKKELVSTTIILISHSKELTSICESVIKI